jgi:hypothetical protein
MNRADHAIRDGFEQSVVRPSRLVVTATGRRDSDCPVEHLRRLADSGRDHVDAMADFDEPSASDGCVQTELPTEAANDIAENPGILLRGVRIVGCHDTTPAEVRKSDLRFGQPQNRTGPLSFGETFNTADHQVRTQAPEVAAERRQRTVGTHEQWEDIEPFWGVESLESSTRLNRCLNAPADLTRLPGQPVHQRLSIHAERCVKSQQTRERPRGDHPTAPIEDLHDAVAQ